MRRGRVLAAVTLLLVLLPAALLVWMRLRTEDRLTEIEPDPDPVIMTVNESSVDEIQPAAVALTWGEPVSVPAPAWQGVVTATHVSPGDALSTGQVVATVDGIERIAAALPEPFWRPLVRNDEGSDVTALQQLLISLGFYDGEADGTVGADTVSAINEFARSLGVPRPDGSFSPGWVVWIPEEGFVVDELGFNLGRPVPEQGADLLLGPAVLTAASITGVEGQTLALDGAWDLEVLGAVFEVEDGELTSGAVDRLAQAAEGNETSLVGRVRRADPRMVLAIPSAAVTTNVDAALCVWVPAEPGFEAQMVSLDGGRAAEAFVVDGLEPGDEVLVNPNDVLGSPTCP